MANIRHFHCCGPNSIPHHLRLSSKTDVQKTCQAMQSCIYSRFGLQMLLQFLDEICVLPFFKGAKFAI